jgi:hypothetical protein
VPSYAAAERAGSRPRALIFPADVSSNNLGDTAPVVGCIMPRDDNPEKLVGVATSR